MSIIATTFCTPENIVPMPVYPLLKHPDERHVNMQTFVNSDLAENVVRETAKFLKKDERVQQLEVPAINRERFHKHSTFVVAASS